MIAPKNKWKFIFTRGVLLAGIGLFVFFQLIQWIKSDMGLVEYIESLTGKEVLRQLVSMLVSGFILGWLFWRQLKQYNSHRH
ncbi:MAG: hypothetical protein PF590_09125 [Candidatus Delongbacteria bacterium]|jgi:uncharacterized BrkB/YihY/UPF0761 family membrane protein|nr:hypothetical protein [Candidatus Delongbacteria bacterium]